ncbi:MAG: hypothetical protein WDM88_04000 [Galbitalea sp.]
MGFIETEFAFMAIYIVLAASFDLIIGRGGMFSISHAAFFAIGAYTVAQLNAVFGVPILLGSGSGRDCYQQASACCWQPWPSG